ncbi:hypothetical protein HHK36_020286 [Tetracentron sinense]|uniref:CCHC-type domain-containing protein n=1 Tax=Tetracentron sinense TaxID=13715 RepID=A0A835D8P6_TETSI|nr:hypothetical protein HHK36_020286 [Tetracentron sinense]
MGRKANPGVSSSSQPPQQAVDVNSFFEALRGMTTAMLKQQQVNSTTGIPHMHTGAADGGKMTQLREFKKMNPSKFSGDPDPLVADRWLKEVKKILEIIDVAEGYRVEFAAHLLVGEADYWWDSVKGRENVKEMSWTRFEEFFLMDKAGIIEQRSEELQKSRENRDQSKSNQQKGGTNSSRRNHRPSPYQRPTGQNQRGSGTSSLGGPRVCFGCGQMGHIQKYCPSSKTSQTQTHRSHQQQSQSRGQYPPRQQTAQSQSELSQIEQRPHYQQPQTQQTTGQQGPPQQQGGGDLSKEKIN